MKLIHGDYADIKVFTDLIDENAIEQIQTIANQPFAEGCQIWSMPDVHAGAGCPVGTTMEIRDKVCPNLVGVDIACGMSVTCIGTTEPDYALLDALINECIPSGMNIRDTPITGPKIDDMEELLHALKCADALDINYMIHSIGTLGGGNHFIEMDKDDNGYNYLVIHSGSRNLGKQVCEYYQNRAIQSLKNDRKETRNEVIQRLKSVGRENEIESTLKAMKNDVIPDDLAYCEGELMKDYLHDMGICERYANLNRESMAQVIMRGMGWGVTDHFVTLHNYIDLHHMILRKGAVSAQKGERLIIPMNMRDGSFICEGKGNPDWNYSAPHGAGRLLSRAKARQTLSMDEFQECMHNVYTTSVNDATIDEAPQVYKPMEEIEKDIADTVTITAKIQPTYNYKVHEIERVWEKNRPETISDELARRAKECREKKPTVGSGTTDYVGVDLP